MNKDWGVHRTHCCIVHGCKYGDGDCPVVNADVEQIYLCEDCQNNLNPMSHFVGEKDKTVKKKKYIRRKFLTQQRKNKIERLFREK